MNNINRRDFIRYGSGLLAATSIGLPLAAQVPEVDPPIYKKSLKIGMIQEGKTLLDKFKLAKELGFDGVELDSPHDYDDDKILRAKEESGIEIPGVVNSAHWTWPLSHPDASVRDYCVKATRQAIDDCKTYGGTTVLLVPGVVNEQISYADAYERSTKEIRSNIMPYAEKKGIQIAFENVWNNFLISPIEAAQYVDQFDSKMVGWYFDVGNIIRYGWADQWIRILGKRILKIDVKEYSRTKQVEEGIWEGFKVLLGDGDSNWAAVNQALRDIGYKGWGSAEVRGGNRERLKEISERMDRIFKL